VPSIVQSDNGSEFINQSFRDLLQSRGIKQITSQAGRPQTQGLVERFNGTLKGMIKKDYLYTGKAEWATELPAFLKAYNSTPQRAT